MKKILLIVLTLALVACGTRRNQFKIEGRFLHLNQGEFYIYSPDGLVRSIDTVPISGGRFVYECICPETGTLMMVFPNFSEQPVFAKSGAKVQVKADASHLKELKVEGTEDNRLMTQFREGVLNMSPPDAKKFAETFIRDHPESMASAYLLKRYFVSDVTPDYGKASQLLDLILQKQTRSGALYRLKDQLEILKKSPVGGTLPSFKATDLNGNTVTEAALRGRVAVVNLWSTWNYESQDIQRRIRTVRREHPGKIAAVSISVDASKRDCRNHLKYDSLGWSVICDEKIFESPLIAKLGLRSIPDNIVLDQNGKIVARGLRAQQMKDKLEEMVK